MVQASDSAETQREVYKWQRAYENKDKCTAIDAYDQIVVLGLNPSKGFVCPLIKDASNGMSVEYEVNIQDYESKYRGQAKVDVIKYLARLDYFVLLINKELVILKQHDLLPIQVYKTKKITNFCLNEEVYRGNSNNRNVSQTDQICICANNTLFFLEAEFVAGIYKFTEDPNPERRKGYSVGVAPENLLWDGDKIYMCSKVAQQFTRIKNLTGREQNYGAYSIMSYATGDILAQLPLQQGEIPMMSALNDKLLVVTNAGSRAQFMSPGGGSTAANNEPSFELEEHCGPGGLAANPLVSIHLVAEYVVAVFETSIAIFKKNGDVLQEIESRMLNAPSSQQQTKFKYVKGAVNIAGDNEVVLFAANTKDVKHSTQTQVIVLREKDYKEQIDELIGMGRIPEAQEVFMSKASKSDNFHKKQKEFKLNAGWQMINTGKPEQTLQFFKMTDVDPRELIILFDDLTKDLRPALNDHIRQLRDGQDLNKHYQSQQRRDSNFDATVKIQKAKEMIKGLFYQLNQKYLNEIRKDEDKQAEFMYSNYALNENVIKRDEKRLLKEILPFVQTALIRLYLDEGDEGRDKIYEFFNQFAKDGENSNHLCLLQQEMETFSQQPLLKQKDVTKEAMALLQEHIQQYQQALDTWEQIRSEESSRRTISILKKSGGSKEWINAYGKQVFKSHPEIALTLFKSNTNIAQGLDNNGGDFGESYDSISMTIEEIIEFLGKIQDEMSAENSQGRQRAGGRGAVQGDQDPGFNLLQRYLEQITEDSRTDPRYFTQLGMLRIQKCVDIYNSKDYGLQDKDTLKNARDELYYFLENKDQYNATELSQVVQQHEFMDTELILLLVKEKKYDQAIERYLQDGKFMDAEEFCANHSQQDGLLTKLLEKYFDKYKEAMAASLHDDSQASIGSDYQERAIRLMQQNSSTGLLDPQVVLQNIPDDWPLQTSNYDLIEFLSSLFDSQMTKEENAMIAANLSGLESFNAEIEKRELESAYLVIRDETECPWCNKTLGFKKIRIFPHGMAFHMRCAKPNECPITKQRFDIDPVTQYD